MITKNDYTLGYIDGLVFALNLIDLDTKDALSIINGKLDELESEL